MLLILLPGEDSGVLRPLLSLTVPVELATQPIMDFCNALYIFVKCASSSDGDMEDICRVVMGAQGKADALNGGRSMTSMARLLTIDRT